MKKLIPKYLKGRWIRVKIQNSNPNNPGKYGYVDVDNNGRPLEWNEKTLKFKVHIDSPNSLNTYWTTISDTQIDYNHNTPEHDLSTKHSKPKNRKEISENKNIDFNNSFSLLYKGATDEILRDFLLKTLTGSAKRIWYDNNGIPQYEFGEKGMSGNDPLGLFYVESVALAKPLSLLNKSVTVPEIRKNIPITYLEGVEGSLKRDSYSNYSKMINNGQITDAGKLDISPILKKWAFHENFRPLFKIKSNDVKDFGEITKLRLIDKGINIDEVRPIDINFKEGLNRYNTIRAFLDSRLNKPVYGGYYKKGPYGGENFPYNDFMITDFSRNDIENIISTLIHEQNGHNTEKIISDIPELKLLYTDFMSNLLSNTPYRFKTSASNHWYELRATTNELVRKFINKVGTLKSYDKNNFYKYIDDLNEDELINTLKHVNAYGADYANAMLQSTGKSQLIRELKDIIKYAPLVIGGGMFINLEGVPNN